MSLITAAKLLLKGKAGLGVIKKVTPTLGLKKTEAYKKALNKKVKKMSDINNEAFVEQLAENLAEELGREATSTEIANEVEKRAGWHIDSVDVDHYLNRRD